MSKSPPNYLPPDTIFYLFQQMAPSSYRHRKLLSTIKKKKFTPTMQNRGLHLYGVESDDGTVSPSSHFWLADIPQMTRILFNHPQHIPLLRMQASPSASRYRGQDEHNPLFFEAQVRRFEDALRNYLPVGTIYRPDHDIEFLQDYFDSYPIQNKKITDPLLITAPYWLARSSVKFDQATIRSLSLTSTNLGYINDKQIAQLPDLLRCFYYALCGLSGDTNLDPWLHWGVLHTSKGILFNPRIALKNLQGDMRYSAFFPGNIKADYLSVWELDSYYAQTVINANFPTLSKFVMRPSMIADGVFEREAAHWNHFNPHMQNALGYSNYIPHEWVLFRINSTSYDVRDLFKDLCTLSYLNKKPPAVKHVPEVTLNAVEDPNVDEVVDVVEQVSAFKPLRARKTNKVIDYSQPLTPEGRVAVSLPNLERRTQRVKEHKELAAKIGDKAARKYLDAQHLLRHTQEDAAYPVPEQTTPANGVADVNELQDQKEELAAYVKDSPDRVKEARKENRKNAFIESKKAPSSIKMQGEINALSDEDIKSALLGVDADEKPLAPYQIHEATTAAAVEKNYVSAVLAVDANTDADSQTMEPPRPTKLPRPSRSERLKMIELDPKDIGVPAEYSDLYPIIEIPIYANKGVYYLGFSDILITAIPRLAKRRYYLERSQSAFRTEFFHAKKQYIERKQAVQAHDNFDVAEKAERLSTVATDIALDAYRESRVHADHFKSMELNIPADLTIPRTTQKLTDPAMVSRKGKAYYHPLVAEEALAILDFFVSHAALGVRADLRLHALAYKRAIQYITNPASGVLQGWLKPDTTLSALTTELENCIQSAPGINLRIAMLLSWQRRRARPMAKYLKHNDPHLRNQKYDVFEQFLMWYAHKYDLPKIDLVLKDKERAEFIARRYMWWRSGGSLVRYLPMNPCWPKGAAIPYYVDIERVLKVANKRCGPSFTQGD